MKIHTGIRSEANLIHLFSGLSERHGDGMYAVIAQRREPLYQNI